MLGDISIATDIYIVTGYTDMRKSIVGLCAIIASQLKEEPRGHTLYMFCGKRCDRIKVLLREPTGFVLLYKRVLVEQRISDRHILKLIRQWLRSGILCGNILTISELGTSQGSVISSLLANIYLNTLDRLWEKYGLTHGIFVRYVDYMVVICKNKKSANHALNLLQYIMAKLDLKLHLVKTKIVCMWDGKEGFDFLGIHHRRMLTET